MDACIREMIRPVWRKGKVYRETFAMIRENGICKARFLFPPAEVLKVESYDGTKTYQEGKDYFVQGDFLVRTENSEIPFTGWERFYFPEREEAEREMEEREEPLGFGPVQTEDGRYVSLTAVGAPSYVTDYQVAVTYLPRENWNCETPERQLDRLPRLEERLKSRSSLNVVLFGDSISCGYDCSGMYGLEPGQPIWPELVKLGLEEEYGVEVQLYNTSVAGMDTDWAVQNAEEKVCRYHPDLVILGFGMNDRCRGTEYLEKTERLVDEVRRNAPETEVLLMATSLPNPLLHTPPFYFCGYQEEQGEVLKKLCRTGIALADIQAVQRNIMRKKRYIDLTGNLLNHPNDYLSRIQAQIVLETMRKR